MTRDASRSRRSLPAIAAMTTLAATTLAGCSWMSPVQTDKPYAPADGVNVQLGQVKVTNLAVVAEAKDSAGALIGQVTNDSSEEVELTLAPDGGSPIVEKVPAGGVLKLAEAGVSVPSVKAAPGAMTTFSISTPSTGAQVTDVPVLAAEGPYATVTPGAPTTEGGTGTPTPTETASPSETPTVEQTSGTVAPTAG